MAGFRIFNALSFLTLATSALAAPSYEPSSSSNGTSICSGTSKCVPFTIDLTWGQANPTNGQARHVILTNGSFPGPPLKLKVGECVDFTVINNLPNATAVHFHGIQQTGTPWSDGVPGLSQYAIKPGTSYMYRWTADESGMFFYHAHYKGQMMDGLYGAIIISAADGADKPFSHISGDAATIKALEKAEANIEPIFASDWVQYTFQEFYAIQEAANIDYACADSIILNGMGSVYCLSQQDIQAQTLPQVTGILQGGSLTAKGCFPASAVTQGNYTHNLAALPPPAYDVCTPSSNKNYTYSVDPADGWAAITFYNPGGFSLLKATIDNHKLYVYEVNGNYVVPQIVDQVFIGNGDRISFFVKLDQQVGDYMIRVANNGLNQILSGYGVLSYKGSSGVSSTSVPTMLFGGANLTNLQPFIAAQAAPYPAVQMSATADVTHIFDIQKLTNQPDAYIWSFSGGQPYSMDHDDQTPYLYQDPSQIQDSDIVIKTQSNQWVDLVVKVQGPIAQPHPIHKHGNKFFVLGTGVGEFPYASVADAAAAGLPLNFNNPPYMDGYTTTPSEKGTTWMVLRYKSDHPGAWFLHCHMQSHFSGGMAIALLDGIDKFPMMPSDAGKVCPGSTSTNSSSSGSSYSGAGTKAGSNSGSTTSSGSSASSTAIAPYTGTNSASVLGSSALVSILAVAIAFLSL